MTQVKDENLNNTQKALKECVETRNFVHVNSGRTAFTFEYHAIGAGYIITASYDNSPTYSMIPIYEKSVINGKMHETIFDWQDEESPTKADKVIYNACKKLWPNAEVINR